MGWRSSNRFAHTIVQAENPLTPEKLPRSASHERSSDQPRLDWGLCVCTLNRSEALQECVRHVLAQDKAPSEMIIVDAGEDWEENRAIIMELMAPRPEIRLVYLQALRRSSATQRNQGIDVARADILFMIDDDSWMYPDCAAHIMSVYETDPNGEIAAVAAQDAPRPASLNVSEMEQKVSGPRKIASGSLAAGIKKFIFREILLMSTERMFVGYDAADFVRPDARDITTKERPKLTHISGYLMTVRRAVAEREPFDAHLLSYAPAEDLDATYRWSRHGVLVAEPMAQIYHHEVAAGRIKRRQATTLGLLNTAYFVRRSSNERLRHTFLWSVFLLRRIVAEALKDTLTRRFTYPQLLGALHAVVLAPRVLSHSKNGLGEWYEHVQMEILKK